MRNDHPVKVMHIAGARPNFMKVAPIMKAFNKYPVKFTQTLVHTGQHYDKNMSRVFFSDLELPQPDVNIKVGSGSHAWQTAQIMLGFEPIVLKYKPDWVIVVGDVNSTLGCALVCSKLGIKVAHVEAGLRSFDKTMPEEINRILTDKIADMLFTTEESATENLLREGIAPEKIYFVGNLMIDTLIRLLPKTENRPLLQELGLMNNNQKITINRYMLVTLHRPGNVDNSETLIEILSALIEISHDVPIIFPVHPRTRKQINGIGLKIPSTSLRLLDPLGYLDFLALLRHAALVLTDSGGIQEETTYLGIPCLTARPNTERPVTISHGTNRLVKSDRYSLVKACRDSLGDMNRRLLRKSIPKLWDGSAAERVVQVLERLT